VPGVPTWGLRALSSRMVSCDLCGAFPRRADASPIGAQGPASTEAQAHASTEADADVHAGADATTEAAADGHADETVPLGWVVSVEAGRTRTYCETCAREYLRSIEAKLDSEWW
jgi:hypothetical protein